MYLGYLPRSSMYNYKELGMKVLCDTCQRGFELPTAIFIQGLGMVRLANRNGQEYVPRHEPTSRETSTVILDGRTGEVLQTVCIGALRVPSVVAH